MTGYDAWKLAEPPEGERMCECGDDYDEHIEEYPVSRLETALVEIEQMAFRWEGGFNRVHVVEAIDRALTKCKAQNCICRGFEPRRRDT